LRSTLSVDADVRSPTNFKRREPTDTLIDRIRHDIQERLEQLRSDAERLGRALAALDPREKSKPRPAARSIPAPAATPKPSPVSPRQGTPSTSKRKPPTRTAPGATKGTVLAALSKDGAMTAGEVAKATGLGRATVSTTLTKLAKSGEVTKAERGYRLPEAGGMSATS
jgi:CRP-like cAMP-binding protein